MLKAEEKLRGSYRIERVRNKGATIPHRFFLLKYLPNRTGKHFFALMVSRKVNLSAVKRNRVRRRLYEAIRIHKNILSGKAGFDILLIVLPAAATATSQMLQTAIKYTLTRLNR